MNDGLNDEDSFKQKPVLTRFCKITVGKERVLGCNIVQSIHIGIGVEEGDPGELYKMILKAINNWEAKKT